MTSTTPVKQDGMIAPTAKSQNGIENHKTAAMHHQEAAKHHLEAATHHEAGNTAKAAESAVKAHGHHALATEHQNEASKKTALKN